MNRAEQIDGEEYYHLAPIAKHFSEHQEPLAAILIYRALANSILVRGLSKNYKIAIGYIKKSGQLAGDVSQWQGYCDHEEYLDQLKTQHARKSAFWAKMS